MSTLRRLLSLFRKRRLDRDMAEEMQYHLKQRTADHIADGLSPDEARFAAQRKFGNTGSLQERAREVRGIPWLEQAVADLRFAVRGLRKNPGFAAIAVLTLALGIGANTSLFTAIDAILLRPLSAPAPERLAYFASGRNEAFSFPFYDRMNRAATSFSGLAAVPYNSSKQEFTVGADAADSVQPQAVTGNYFSVLGASARLGRALTVEDDRPGAAQPVAVISHAFWERRFNSDPSVIGRAARIDTVPVTIVGVMPPEFASFETTSRPDVWYPLQLVAALDDPQRSRLAEGVDWLVLFGRLRDGATLAQATTEVGTIFRRQLEAEIASRPGRPSAEYDRIRSRTLELLPGAAGFVGARSQFRQPLVILMAAVGLVLVIACTNVAGLVLARGAARQREFAVRAALGAGRARIVRQLMTESVLLAVLGGALGYLFAWWGTEVLASYLSQSGAVVPLAPDRRVLAFTTGASLLTGLLVGLAPALRLSGLDLVTAIKGPGGAVAGVAGGRLQPLLVVAQVALCVLLLAGAGLFVRTVHNLRTVDLGFAPDNLITLNVDPGRNRAAPAQAAALQRLLLQKLESIPGVASVSLAGGGLLTGNGIRTNLTIEGYTPGADEEVAASVVLAGPRFFETMRVPVLRGREFSSSVTADAPANVALIGEALAKKYFGDADPIGRHLTPSNGQPVPLEIIGVARDTRYTRNLRDAAPMQFYVPYWNSTVRMPPTFYVRARLSVAALGPDLRRIVQEVSPQMSVRSLRPMDEVIDRLLVRERIIAQLIAFFSGFSLLLASLGVYGILSYGVTRRTREIGVRLALGATLRDVVSLVLRQGLGLVVLGCATGLAAAFLLTRYVESLLYGIAPADPLTFIAVAVLLFTVALVACWFPARRAAKVDPMIALRAE